MSKLRASAESASEWRPVLRFYVLAVLIAWILWAPVILSRTGLGVLPVSIPLPMVIFGALGPPLAACIVQWWECRDLRIARVLVPWRRGILGVVFGCLIVAVTFVVGTAVLLSKHPPEGWKFAAFGLYGSDLLMKLIGGPIFEEWGWRGFAQARLQRHLGALRAALVVGLGWGLWHLPMFLVPSWSSASPLSFVVMMIALSVILAWAFNYSGGTVITPILMHAVFNRSSQVLGVFLGSAALRSEPAPVTAIALALSGVAVLIVLMTRGRLGWVDRTPASEAYKNSFLEGG